MKCLILVLMADSPLSRYERYILVFEFTV